MSIGVNGVLGVPGMLRPVNDGVRGIDPEKLRGGLKSDNGVGGADFMAESTSSPLLGPERAPSPGACGGLELP